MPLDAIDLRIITCMQDRGRITNQDLALEIGLSPSACLRRVQILERDGIILGYGVRLSEASLGYRTTVVVQITLDRQTEEALETFEQAVRAHPEIMEAYLMSGDADYMLRVVVRDPSDYERLHKDVLSKLPGVARLQSNFALRTVVRRQSLPVAANQGAAP